ncbi:MAG TPA: 2-(1,2-epoxy-1,2-dihydrophenyl)acetyl-CoA isomerase PaaG [Bacteroidia bacterium]|jgi:2-(1,2-epoxy-1,2-dihydrophenyl)acetyl-CoA isomerase|nr:2-(1,2-epoxy-1,2-dihydrophenyl)acetyl-CoA isomerase PaaG [Bacteroidia bacterium]
MSTIKTEQLGGVLKITLNRPDKFNSFNREMALSLQQALDKSAEDKNIRCIYITGEGKAFCAGQDLSEAMNDNGPGIERIVREHYNPIIEKIRALEKPVVCAVNGVAAGAGANIALACDVVIAGNSVAFIQAFSKIGLIPDSGGTYFLPRLVGFGKASALMMLGDKVTASDAERMGMIYKVAADEKLQEEALAIAKTLSELPTIAIGLTKRLLNQSMFNPLDKQLEYEADTQVHAAQSKDYTEGVKAFLEKRKAVFSGE